MFARIECPDGQVGVDVVGCRDHDECDRGIGQGFVEIGVAAHLVAPERHGLGSDLGDRERRSRAGSARAGDGSRDSEMPGPPGHDRRRPFLSMFAFPFQEPYRRVFLIIIDGAARVRNELLALDRTGEMFVAGDGVLMCAALVAQ